MNGKTPEFQTKPACSEKYDLFPVTIKCKQCGLDVEMWADEDEALCGRCGEKIKREPKG